MARHFFEGQVRKLESGFCYTLTTTTAGSTWTSPEVRLEAKDEQGARAEVMERCAAFLRALKGEGSELAESAG